MTLLTFFITAVASFMAGFLTCAVVASDDTEEDYDRWEDDYHDR